MGQVTPENRFQDSQRGQQCQSNSDFSELLLTLDLYTNSKCIGG